MCPRWESRERFQQIIVDTYGKWKGNKKLPVQKKAKRFINAPYVEKRKW